MVYTKHKFTRAAKGIVLEEIVIKLYQLFLWLIDKLCDLQTHKAQRVLGHQAVN